MKKRLILLLILFLSILILTLNYKNILESLIENRLSSLTKHKVKLSLTKFNLLSGSIELKEIKLENKKNFFNQNIFEAEKIFIKLDTKTYLSNLVIIESITFYKPKFYFEIKNIDKENKKNAKDNLEILEKLTGETKSTIYPKKKKDKNFLINQLRINDAEAYIKHDSNRENLPITLSGMSFVNVGNAGNKKIKFQHYKDIMKIILNDIFFRIPDENLRNLIKKKYITK